MPPAQLRQSRKPAQCIGSFFAYIDGELAGDPALQAMVAEHRALAARLDRAVMPILQEPIPPVHSESPSSGSGVASLSQARARREQRRSPTPVAHWFALAAALAAGIFGGMMFSGGGEGRWSNAMGS